MKLNAPKRTRCKWPGCLRPATLQAVYPWGAEPCCEECKAQIELRAKALNASVTFEPLTLRSE